MEAGMKKTNILIPFFIMIMVLSSACASSSNSPDQILETQEESSKSESTISETIENPSDTYETALNKIASGDTIEAMELLAKIPSYKDSELYLLGYSQLEYFIGTWEVDLDEGFEKGTTVFPYEMSFIISDSGIWLDEESNGFQRLRFPVSVTYTIRKYNKTESGTKDYEGYLFFYQDKDNSDLTVAFGVEEGGFWYNLKKDEENRIKGSFSVSDDSGNVDTSANNYFYCDRKSERQNANIKWDKTEKPAQKNDAGSSKPSTNEEPLQNNNLNNANATSGEKNALSRAKDYLAYTAFSYDGLIEQLEYEGFSQSEAQYGADNCGADWKEQAARKAKEYLEFSAFSYKGLIEQLEYEGFTSVEAEYGVDNCGADWKEQAAEKAKQYLEFSSFSRQELVDQLVYEGFTQEQAEYGVNKVY